MNELDQRVADSKKNVIASDRRARTSRAVFMVALVGAIAALLIITASTLDRVEAQVRNQNQILNQLSTLLQEQRTSTDDLKKNNADQLDKLTRHIDCLATFFATSDRNDRVIEDVNKCVITSAAPSSDTAPAAAQNAPSPKPGQLTVSPAQSSLQPSTSPQDNQQSAPPSQPQAQPSLIQQLLTSIGGILRL